MSQPQRAVSLHLDSVYPSWHCLAWLVSIASCPTCLSVRRSGVFRRFPPRRSTCSHGPEHRGQFSDGRREKDKPVRLMLTWFRYMVSLHGFDFGPRNRAAGSRGWGQMRACRFLEQILRRSMPVGRRAEPPGSGECARSIAFDGRRVCLPWIQSRPPSPVGTLGAIVWTSTPVRQPTEAVTDNHPLSFVCIGIRTLDPMDTICQDFYRE